jgi:hypothetical protein
MEKYFIYAVKNTFHESKTSLYNNYNIVRTIYTV